MSSYKLIIKRILNFNNNIFQPNYRSDNIDNLCKLYFFSLLKNKINIQTKYQFFYNTINNFISKKNDVVKNEFIDLFCKIQKTYNSLNQFIYIIKYNRAKLIVEEDIGLNKLEQNAKNVICIYQKNAKYLFATHDLIQIIETSLTNSQFFFAEPQYIKNPYTNLPFNKSSLYNIYFFIKLKTTCFCDLFLKFYKCNFNMGLFKMNNEYLLREHSIKNYVYKSTNDILIEEIKRLIDFYNYKNTNHKILIDNEFPANKLIKIFKPYLLIHIKSLFGYLEIDRIDASNELMNRLKRFNMFNPQFGRKLYKFTTINKQRFKQKIIMDSFEFNDKFTPFNDIKNENENFLIDHLNYTYNNFTEIYPEQNNLTNNIISVHDDDDDEEEEGEVEEEGQIDEEEEEGEIDEEEEEGEIDEQWEEYYDDEVDDGSVS